MGRFRGTPVARLRRTLEAGCMHSIQPKRTVQLKEVRVQVIYSEQQVKEMMECLAQIEMQLSPKRSGLA